jgi:hypothetical protein
MNKDVIYIDVDDDVTAIIGKIKSAKEKIVALVPPKRAGALQSAVNLRLLERMAKTDKKQLVLITNNQALIGLAANAKIPVAKNLQSKPEVAEVPALIVDEGDDIIDGADLPVGDHAATVKVKDGTQVASDPRSDAIDTTDLDIDGEDVAVGAAASKRAVSKTATKKGKNRPKIPNFDSFRKKLFFGIAGGVALIALLVWMFVFAPAATIIITAGTTPTPVSASIKLGGTAATDYQKGIVSSVSKQDKKDATLEFTATGQKDVGEKATGTLKVSRLTQSDYTLPAGSSFTATNGLVFKTDKDVVIPASQPCFPSYCAQSATVTVTAAESGTSYNGVTGTATGPSGTTGTFQGATAGGTSEIVKVVSADDVERAKGDLLGKSTDEEKKALAKSFTNGEIVVDGSFTVSRGDATSSPAVGQEAPNGKATLTVPTTYTIQAIPKADLDSYLKSYLNAKLDSPDTQKVYSTGINEATVGNYRQEGDTMLATVNATGSIGPKIDEAAVKDQVEGKRYGEVQQSLEAIDGIQEVDVQFSYFWVRTVPNNPNKISIEFKVKNEE